MIAGVMATAEAAEEGTAEELPEKNLLVKDERNTDYVG